MKTVLVFNSGSSSLKFAAFAITDDNQPGERLSAGQVSGLHSNAAELVVHRPHDSALHIDLGQCDHAQALDAVLHWFEQRMPSLEVMSVGHRIVHGGEQFQAPVRINALVIRALDALCPLAPLHQPHNLAAVRAIQKLRPRTPQVACFDTAFHLDQPTVARSFALPQSLTESGIRRYGFHGLSYDHVSRQLPNVLGTAAEGAVVIAHLGAGASLCALRGGRSMATTMSFTALDGLMMNTRCGQLDPGVLLYLMEAHGMDVAELTRVLYHESGLLGVSGISGDMRDLLASDEAGAQTAIDLYCYRVARETGSMMAAAEGLDALVFTAGIGEHTPEIRARICHRLGWAGVRLDEQLNSHGARRIEAAHSDVAVAIIPTDEELVIAERTLTTLADR